ncbi:hypothetical protein [Hymenobacter cavernae]|uniref:Uncharacterized protein n=1 Tax=Hymenobacter cavernae TaxID=2044852 RepID=A0ABQ1UF51_9BACT|nr:hypothetical protein [Hymenobacter cavernae]GGF17184.1 hypothetical protein GCM10011383_30780 [Hymenobacter cavernae]
MSFDNSFRITRYNTRFRADTGFFQALLNLAELDAYNATVGTILLVNGVILLYYQPPSCTIKHLVIMAPTPIQPTRLNPVQVSLLRLFERGMSDEDILDLQRVIVAHLSQKMLAEVERIDTERGYTAEDYEQMLNEPS